MKKLVSEEKKVKQHLTEPLPVISTALETGLLGKQPLVRYLNNFETQLILQKTDQQDLLDSISAYPNHRRGISMQLAADALFRFAVVLQEMRPALKPTHQDGMGSGATAFDPALLYVHLAIKCYDVLLFACNSDKHPPIFSALSNNFTLACIERARLQATTRLASANSPGAGSRGDQGSPKKEIGDLAALQTDYSAYRTRHEQPHLQVWKPLSVRQAEAEAKQQALEAARQEARANRAKAGTISADLLKRLATDHRTSPSRVDSVAKPESQGEEIVAVLKPKKKSRKFGQQKKKKANVKFTFDTADQQ